MLLGGFKMIGINSPDVGVPAIDAAPELPLIDDRLQTGSGLLEVRAANHEAALAGSLKTPLAIVRVGSPALVSRLGLHLLLRQLPLLGLGFTTDA